MPPKTHSVPKFQKKSPNLRFDNGLKAGSKKANLAIRRSWKGFPLPFAGGKILNRIHFSQNLIPHPGLNRIGKAIALLQGIAIILTQTEKTMFRRILGSCAIALIGAFGLIAAEIKGKIVKIDDAAKTIVVKVEDSDKTYTYNADTKFVTTGGKELKEEARTKLFASKKGGREVTLTTEKKGDKEVVTEVKLAAGKKKDSK